MLIIVLIEMICNGEEIVVIEKKMFVGEDIGNLDKLGMIVFR